MIKSLEQEISLIQLAMVIGFIAFAVGLFSFLANLNRLGRENNTYHRTVACILSVPLADRTDSYISQCYQGAEAKNDIQVDRYGNK